ncbi:zinc finger protein 385A-like isoform X2 [Entelurus aequoreus]|uniref:zinc finger protein 385A-like isoform X2 n=1 Tax=Entelurus aequoreus TaxID=161455 RepID=UPI002B1CFE76|nr:zinc finger protein 385A-like isoform X2 [Entelurus aequoreus]
MILGGLNGVGPALPAFLRTPAVIPPCPLDLKPFLPLPLESPHPAALGLFRNFNTMDPVQKAVMTHTFGPPVVRTKRPIISCNVCQIRFNSESQAEAHYKGNRHARRVKGIETSKTPRHQDGDKQRPPPTTSPSLSGPSPSSLDTDPSKPDDTQSCPSSGSPLALSHLSTSTVGSADAECPFSESAGTPLPSSPTLSTPPADSAGAALSDAPSPAPSPSSGESEEEKAKKLLYCSLCKVVVNSLSQLEAHNKGSSEQGGALSSDPNTQERTFHCEICNVRVTSELQLKQHISSRRHRDGVAGKPNPLLNRNKKRADFMELPKTLGAGLLPNPLAVAAVMAAAASSNRLALRAPGPASHHHPHHHLLQGAPLSLLRPAPGPIRTAHGPILFAPY